MLYNEQYSPERKTQSQNFQKVLVVYQKGDSYCTELLEVILFCEEFLKLLVNSP